MLDVEYDPCYKKDRPPDCVMYIVMYGKCIILDYIGPAVDYFSRESITSLAEMIDAYVINDGDFGAYIWSGHFKTIKYDAGDCDVEMVGNTRLATKEEWYAHINDEFPWDRSLWRNDV